MRRKCLLLFITLLFSCLLFSTKIKAEKSYYYRLQKDNKPTVNINGVTVYVNVGLGTNISTDSEEYFPIDGITATYSNQNVYITLKRSEINKILKENTFQSVSPSISVHGDYLGIDDFNKYYFFWSPNFSDEDRFYYETGQANWEMRNYNIFEVFTSSTRLVGGNPERSDSRSGAKYLFKSDTMPSNYEVSKLYSSNEFDTSSNLVFSIPRLKLQIAVVEDEAIDIGDNKIVQRKGILDENGNHVGTELEEVNIDNFYAEYFENNKLAYSWTMYDNDGNPVEININTYIKIDDSENEKEILSSIQYEYPNLIDKIKIISFEHDGDLGATAQVKLYVGDKFAPGSILNLYYYNPEGKNLEGQTINPNDATKSNDITVDSEGYVVLTITHCSEYVLADADVSKVIDDQIAESDVKTIGSAKNNSNLFKYLICILVIALCIVSFIFIIKALKKRKKAEFKEELISTDISNNNSNNND